jgi:hypothetical protein
MKIKYGCFTIEPHLIKQRRSVFVKGKNLKHGTKQHIFICC